MKHSTAVLFLLAIVGVAAGCGEPSPEAVCSKLKDLGAGGVGDCQAKWAAKQTSSPDVYKKNAACVFKAVTGAEAAVCQAP